jgi:phosphatidate cytidylyltransferase
MVSSPKALPLTYLGIIGTLFFIISRNPDLLPVLEPHFPLALTSLMIISLAWLLMRRQKEGAFAGWAWTMAGVLYAGWLLGYLVELRGIDEGRNWIFMAILVTFASDTAAFFVGRAWGRHKLAPQISPNKTWEGAAGGVCGAMLASLFFILPTRLSLSQHLNWWLAVVLGLLISVFGQLGDLAESLLKRNMGVKDSGKLIPGHGGILDRMDSIVFAGVVVYYYVSWLIQ